MTINNKLSFAIPSKHPCYAAHFPGDPIVPGALLLQWILRQLKQCHPNIRISSLRTVKFLSVVRPGDNCLLSFEQNTDTTRLKINLLCNDKPALKGKFDIQTIDKI
jgi:3-hydroxymyristoyl/3-hydroxydecanoyl-(acyl carrier protein) dehydratase